MNIDLSDLALGSLRLFCRVAETESFAAAARQKGLTPAAVSRSVARLEARLGVRLFERSTRRVRLSEAGRNYYACCRQALSLLDDGAQQLDGAQLAPEGRVRISLPTPLGHRRILPLLPVFLDRYPRVQLDIHLGNRNVDLIAEGFDLAVRGRTPPDSSLVARPLIEDPLVVVASPSYLEQAGTPTTLAALDDHDCIQFRLPSTGAPVPWLFRDEGAEVSRLTEGRLMVEDDLLGAITLACHGGGLLQVPRFMVEDALAEGRLRTVLEDYGGRTRPFSLIYRAQRPLPLRVRLLVDYLLSAVHPAIAKRL